MIKDQEAEQKPTDWEEYETLVRALVPNPKTKDEELAKIRELYDALPRAAALPEPRRSEAFSFAVYKASLREGRYLATEAFTGAWDDAMLSSDQHATDLLATRLMLAVDRHRAGEGRLPRSLDDLIPALLPWPPRDPRWDDPIVYRVVPRPEEPGVEDYILYAYGANRRDDGGTWSRRDMAFSPMIEPEMEVDFALVRPRRPSR